MPLTKIPNALLNSGAGVGANNLLLLDANGKAPTSAMPAGAVLLVVNSTTTASATGTTTIPSDNTIPQITEGTQFLSLSVTPTSATSKLRIDVSVFVATSNLNSVVAALFQDSTANALAATIASTSANELVCISFSHYMTAGTTSTTTFRVRLGPTAAGTITLNGFGGAQLFGGVASSSITITEIAA